MTNLKSMSLANYQQSKVVVGRVRDYYINKLECFTVAEFVKLVLYFRVKQRAK